MERSISLNTNRYLLVASSLLILTVAFTSPAHAAVVVNTPVGVINVGSDTGYYGYGYRNAYRGAYHYGYGHGTAYRRGYHGNTAYHHGNKHGTVVHNGNVHHYNRR